MPGGVQNDFQPLVPTIKWKPTPGGPKASSMPDRSSRRRFSNGILACFPSATLINSRVDKAAAIDATLSAMDQVCH